MVLLRKTILEADRASAEMVINMEYTQANLLLWKTIFDAQSKRSDLIFGTNLSTNNTRFIHMNPGNFTQVSTESGASDREMFLFSRLGDDA